jgi:TonB family protein
MFRKSVWIVAGVVIALCAPITALQAQDTPAASTPDVEAAIRVAQSQGSPAIVDTAAASFIAQKNYAVAEKLLVAGLAIRVAASGGKSKEYAIGLVKLGDLEVKRNKSDEAVELYKRAVAVGDSPEVVPALIYLGMRSDNKQQMPAALDYLQRAIAVAANPQESGRAMTWLAFVESHDPAMESQAETHFRTAIGQQDPNSAGEANSLDLFARFLEQHDHADEAKDLRARSSEIVKTQVSETQVASHAAFPEVFRASIAGGTTPPKLIKKVEPEYTEDARAAKYSGTVVLQVVIGIDGLAHNAQVVKSLGMGLDVKAVEAVSQWQFNPGTKDGATVPIAATIEVNFKLM